MAPRLSLLLFGLDLLTVLLLSRAQRGLAELQGEVLVTLVVLRLSLLLFGLDLLTVLL